MAGTRAGALKGWATRREREERERYQEQASLHDRVADWEAAQDLDWIIEEPIDEVGGKYYE